MFYRTGKVLKLSVQREEMEGEPEPVELILSGRFSVFNLDPKVSKIYVGGIPAGVEVNSDIRSTSFDGNMEDLRLNDQPIGLWNFMADGTNNIAGQGAMERLVNSGFLVVLQHCESHLNIFYS